MEPLKKPFIRWAAATFNVGVAVLAFFYGQWALGVLFLMIGPVFFYLAVMD